MSVPGTPRHLTSPGPMAHEHELAFSNRPARPLRASAVSARPSPRGSADVTNVEPTPAAALGMLHGALRARGVTGWLREPACGRALLVAGHTIVLYRDGCFWWRTGRVRDGRDILGTHVAADPAGAARRLCRLIQASVTRRGEQTAARREDAGRPTGLWPLLSASSITPRPTAPSADC